MLSLFLEPFLLLVSSLVSLAVVFYNIPTSTVQQAIAALLIILLIIINRSVLSRHQAISRKFIDLIVFLVATFLQLLILSSGGFYSPFLILFHLFAIGSGFLLNLRIAIGFLVFAVSVLIINTLFLDKKLLMVFTNDPWAAVLYILSFIIIVPIFQVVVSRYHLKDTISKALTTQLKATDTQLKLSQKRHESLLGGLSDLAIVTNVHLRILSFNEITTRSLHLSSSELLGRSLFDVLFLKNIEGAMIDSQLLGIEKVLNDGLGFDVNNLLLYTKNSTLPKKVSIQIRPTTNLDGRIDQIVFIISGAFAENIHSQMFHNTEQAILRSESSLEELKNNLRDRGLEDLRARVELLGKAEKDILLASELEDHGVKPSLTLADIAELVQKVITREQSIATSLRVNLRLSFDPQFTARFMTLQLGNGQVPVMMTSPYFTVAVEPKWFDLLMGKLVDLAIFLSSREKSPQVTVWLSYTNENVEVLVSTSCSLPLVGRESLLLTEYYGDLGTQSGLSLGSGLEGYIAKSIATLLNIPIEVKYQPDLSSLALILKLSKKPIT